MTGGMLYINGKTGRISNAGSRRCYGRLRVRVLEEWQTIFIEIAGEINYSAESMSQICSRIENMSVYGKKFWGEMSKQTKYKNEGLIGTFWKEYLDGYKYWELLSAEDKNIIYRFGESFGTLDIYSQINQIKMYEKRIEGNISDARQKMREQKKVCIFMGLISGLMAGICLF